MLLVTQEVADKFIEKFFEGWDVPPARFWCWSKSQSWSRIFKQIYYHCSI